MVALHCPLYASIAIATQERSNGSSIDALEKELCPVRRCLPISSSSPIKGRHKGRKRGKEERREKDILNVPFILDCT
jgi:hypothetical protein